MDIRFKSCIGKPEQSHLQDRMQQYTFDRNAQPVFMQTLAETVCVLKHRSVLPLAAAADDKQHNRAQKG